MDTAAQCLVLLGVPGLGSAGLVQLIERCGSPGAVLATPAQTLAEWGLSADACRWLARPDLASVEKDLALLRRLGARVIPLGDPLYPRLLGEIPGPPMALFVRGDAGCLGERQLAIVGSRSPSPAGRETARELAFSASKTGLVITSGLARGIDAAAHRGALDAGGRTIAVMATGPERIYPAAHRRLAEHIVENGALVSEFPPGVPPRRGHFPSRNRIISGLSLGTLVVEAAMRSGSLITARLAGEQGREVLAVPGSINNPVARGCHRLIRDGARLVESIADVLEELGFMAGARAKETPAGSGQQPHGMDADEAGMLDFMGFDPAHPDELIARSGLTADAVSSILFSLELQGIIEPVPGGAFVRVSKRPLNERKRT